MIALFRILVLLEIVIAPGVVASYYDSGIVAYYQDPDLMRDVWEYRKSWGQDLGNFDDYVDGIALNSCDYLGRTVWIRYKQGLLIGPLLVVDCACKEHLPSRESRGLIADLGYYTAVKLLKADTYLQGVIIYLENE